MVHATCAALRCLSSSNTNKKLRFHQFPHDAERRKIWIIACKRTDVIDKDWNYFKHKYLCSLHFQKCMYGKKEHLKKSAIPSLNLSDKPLQHNSSTQTWDTIEYVKPYQEIEKNKVVGGESKKQNKVSIVYIMPNTSKILATSSTQTEDSLPDSSLDKEIKKEIEDDTLPDTQMDDSDESEQDVEIKTEIEENEILPHTQSTQFKESLQNIDLQKEEQDCKTPGAQTQKLLPEIEQGHEDADHGIPRAQVEKLLKEIEQVKKESETGTNVNKPIISTTENLIDAANQPVKKGIKRKVDGTMQTHTVIVYTPPRLRQEGVNPQYCECKGINSNNEKNIEDITRSQFLKACNKYLSPEFCVIVKKEMKIDMLKKRFFQSIPDQLADCAAAGATNTKYKTNEEQCFFSIR